MKRFPMLMLCCLAVGCADTIESPQPFDIEEAPKPSDETTRPPVVQETPIELIELSLPATGCDEPSMITALDFANSAVAEPRITETFGPDGCIDERWQHERDGELHTHLLYEFFDASLGQFTYVDPENFSQRWTYDAAGRNLLETYAAAPDAEPHRVTTRTYDSQGRMLSQERRDLQVNGAPEHVTLETWTYPATGELFETHDLTVNGESLEASRRVMDSQNRIIEEYRTRYGAEHIVLRREYRGDLEVRVQTWDDWSGRPWWDARMEYRADGTLKRRVSDNLDQGWHEVREYDEQERNVLYTQDESNDGPIEYRQIWRYDGDNLVFSSTEYDFDQPTTRYAQTEFQFDEQGRMIHALQQEVWLGDEMLRTQITYDEVGDGFHTEVARLDRNGDVIAIQRETQHLDEERLAWSLSDSDRDGIAEWSETYTWDGPRQLQLVRVHNDGAPHIEQWRHDAAGQLVEHAIDQDGDNVVDYRTIHAR